MKKTILVCLICFVLGVAGIPAFAETMLNNPPFLPSDPHPTDGAVDVGLKTHLSWIGGDPDPGDKAVYDLYFGTTSEPGMFAANLQMPNYYPGVLTNNTQYYWKVVARDTSQAETSGPIWTFTTNTCDCDPPEKPEGQNQTRNRYRYEYATRIMNMHQHHNGLYYQFSWGDGNYSEWIGPYNNSERVRAQHEWTEPGNYQVQARARFENNPPSCLAVMVDWVYTGWSEPLAVVSTVADNNPPYVPSNPHPADGATDIGIKTHLSWTGGDPDPGDKAVYDLYFGTASEPGLLVTNLQMPTYFPGVLLNNTQYYWKVVARDASQAETSGPIWTFTTNNCDCDPPEKPEGQYQIRNRHRYEYKTQIMNMHQNHNGLYYQFSWGDGNYSEWMGPYTNNERVRAEHEWSEPGSYQVQARARFQNNPPLSLAVMDDWLYTGWSEPLTVTATSTGNNAPSAPSISGTQNGKVGESYDYTISAVDSDGDDVYIYVEFCEGCAEAQWHGPLASGEVLTIAHAWETKGQYMIRAQTKDTSDALSDWSTLPVTMPYSFIWQHPILTMIWEKLVLRFSLFHQFSS